MECDPLLLSEMPWEREGRGMPVRRRGLKINSACSQTATNNLWSGLGALQNALEILKGVSEAKRS
ncbi:hypothetical protein thsrh120_31110 [Rhizobium sp. No.120]